MASNSQDRPPIPAEIKREVRQRCGFGCVICGTPLYEYEHMLEWAKTRRHVADEITLLCKKHHSEKTVGLLPIKKVREANDNPFNVSNGASSPYHLHYSGDSSKMIIGGNTFHTLPGLPAVGLVMDQVPMVAFTRHEDQYLLNLTLFDEYNKQVLVINENELVYTSEPWDVDFVGRKLTVWAAKRKIFIEVTFEPPDTIRIERGRILLNGIELYIRPKYIFVINNAALIHDSTYQEAVGISIGKPVTAGLSMTSIPRYGIDRPAAMKSLKKTLERISSIDKAGTGGEPPGWGSQSDPRRT